MTDEASPQAATEIERLRTQLAAAEARLAEIQRAQTDAVQAAARMEATAMLASSIAHDFNNLMVGVMGNAALARDELPEDHPSAALLRTIEESAARAADLARQTVSFARRGRYEQRRVNLNDLALRAIQLHEGVEPGNLRVDRNLDPKLWPVHADPAQLSQVVTNLYTRALEAMGGHGSIMVTTRNLSLGRQDSLSSFHDAIRAGRYAYLALEYTLPGPAAPQRPGALPPQPVFSTRFQSEAAGLAALYAIVKNHQGRLFQDAEPGSNHGLFRLYVPAAEALADTRAPAAAAAEIMPEMGLAIGSETVLLVDDEPVVLKVTQAILERLGYSVLPAHDGREAIDIVSSYDGPIDLAILDLGMPIMSGQEAFPLLRTARPGMKIIVSSGYDEHDVAQDLLAAGASAFIQKPFTIAFFAPKLREVLDRPAQP